METKAPAAFGLNLESRIRNRLLLLVSGLFALFLSAVMSPVQAERMNLIPKWSRFEESFTSNVEYRNPVQEVELRVVFTSPQGNSSIVSGFWDGGQTWRVRFAPNELGTWLFSTACSDSSNTGLRNQSGSFVCTASRNQTVFDKHGPVRVSFNGRYLMHDDATPFFWLADTAWNGPLLSTPDEWALYIQERKRQKFSVVQWVTTQFRDAPEGDRARQLAYTGTDQIAINPAFFQALDGKVDQLDKAGLLSAPVLLWAVNAGANPKVNPGFGLPDDQAILLARYIVARWGANNVLWILGGDGDYLGPNAERWKRIGHEVFSESGHAPVAMHPGGMQWIGDIFAKEEWLGVIGYQSGQGDSDDALRWLSEGPPTTEWEKAPFRPVINLEPAYENSRAYQSKQPHTPETVRRAVYWSLLDAPTAGVTYGGHGVWGWDDGTHPPADHPDSGVPLSWEKALEMPGANQMTHLAELFNSIEFWRLRPAPEILATQPGKETPRRHIALARSDRGDRIVAYVPEDRTVALMTRNLPPRYSARWLNPRTGQSTPATGTPQGDGTDFATPEAGDWILMVETGK